MDLEKPKAESPKPNTSNTSSSLSEMAKEVAKMRTPEMVASFKKIAQASVDSLKKVTK